jgi:DNA-binding NtrC family response regulator
MPEMDGPAMITAIREIDPDVKIIGMSGLTDPAQTAALQKLSVTSFVTKPFTAEKLLMAISQAIGKT